MRVRGGPTQARLVPNSLLTKPLPSGAQVVIGKKRAREREFPFLFPSSPPAPAMRVTKRTGDDSATWLHNNSLCTETDALPPLPSEKIGQRDSLPDFFLMGWGGWGDICTQATQLQYYITCFVVD